MALGPLMISLPRLFFVLGLVAALLVAWVRERRGGESIEGPLWWSLLAGVIAARTGYVLSHWSAFKLEPLTALYLWQDGHSLLAGLAAAALVLAWFGYNRRGYRPKSLLVPVLSGLVVWGGLSWVSLSLQRATDQPLPDMVMEDLGGRSVSLADFRGQPVVLNLWATWCPPCRREMPVLAEAQAERRGIHFVFANQAEGPGKIRQFLAADQLRLENVLLDLGGNAGRHFNSPGLPTTLFFDAQGQLVDTHLGELSRARLGDYLRKLER